MCSKIKVLTLNSELPQSRFLIFWRGNYEPTVDLNTDWGNIELSKMIEFCSAKLVNLCFKKSYFVFKFNFTRCIEGFFQFSILKRVKQTGLKIKIIF